MATFKPRSPRTPYPIINCGQAALRALPHSQATIAAACGVVQATVSKWACGTDVPEHDARVALRGAYGIDPLSWARRPVPERIAGATPAERIAGATPAERIAVGRARVARAGQLRAAKTPEDEIKAILARELPVPKPAKLPPGSATGLDRWVEVTGAEPDDPAFAAELALEPYDAPGLAEEAEASLLAPPLTGLDRWRAASGLGDLSENPPAELAEWLKSRPNDDPAVIEAIDLARNG